MRILLLGEYSGLHNSLKKGLIELGHDVVLIGNGDGFKNYPVDIMIDHSFHRPFLKKIRVGIHRILNIDIASIEVRFKAKRKLESIENFEVVQLINDSFLHIQPHHQLPLLKTIRNKTKKLFLLSAGIDHSCMRYMMSGKFRYSIMSPYLNDPNLHELYKWQLQYLNKDFTYLHDTIMENVDGIMASDLDYHIPLQNEKKYLGMISNPIDLSVLPYIDPTNIGKIKIFHGVNQEAYIKKGNRFFDEALEIIQGKFSNKVEITRTTNIPYKEYIDIYNNCHILLDQVYAHDQGYNALEAMAKGKVVFTGAEREWLDYYDLEEDTVAINALPDAQKIADKLEWLILNPDKIIEISINARKFVEKEHDHIKSAQQYIDKWASV